MLTALAARTEALAREWKPDLLHAHSPVLDGLAALRAGKRLGIPVIYEIRAFWEDAAVGNGTGREGGARYFLTRQLETRAVKSADAVKVKPPAARTSPLFSTPNFTLAVSVTPWLVTV